MAFLNFYCNYPLNFYLYLRHKFCYSFFLILSQVSDRISHAAMGLLFVSSTALFYIQKGLMKKKKDWIHVGN